MYMYNPLLISYVCVCLCVSDGKVNTEATADDVTTFLPSLLVLLGHYSLASEC